MALREEAILMPGRWFQVEEGTRVEALQVEPTGVVVSKDPAPWKLRAVRSEG